MTAESFVFPLRLARLRAPLAAALFLSLTSCHSTDPLSEPTGVDDRPIPGETDDPSLAVAWAGGIPFGVFALPTSQLGSTYNGVVRNARVWVDSGGAANFTNQLAAIKSKNAKVFLQLTGNHQYYLDSDGHFSMTKWKDRLNMFKSIDFSSYINDGTIIAHYLIDEPNQASDFGGTAVPRAAVEEMAKYSKQLWPGMATVARVESSWLASWSGSYQYLDAAWAQYATRKGDVYDFINRNVADAQKKGLALVTGLNVAKGANGAANMSATQIKAFGSALLSSSYPCAFISWEYHDTLEAYLATTAVKDAMKSLRAKAQNRNYKTCKS
jgi:hypothetical protein